MTEVVLFQSRIKANEGFIVSDGTLNVQHLLAKSFDVMQQNGLNEELATKVWNEFEWTQTGADGTADKCMADLFRFQYCSWCKIKNRESALDVWNEVFDYFIEISPDGYRFGSNEGDGACIGWWKEEEEVSTYKNYGDANPLWHGGFWIKKSFGNRYDFVKLDVNEYDEENPYTLYSGCVDFGEDEWYDLEEVSEYADWTKETSVEQKCMDLVYYYGGENFGAYPCHYGTEEEVIEELKTYEIEV